MWLFKDKVVKIKIPLDGNNDSLVLKSGNLLKHTIEIKEFGIVEDVASADDSFQLNVYCNKIQYWAIQDLVRVLGFSNVVYTVNRIL